MDFFSNVVVGFKKSEISTLIATSLLDQIKCGTFNCEKKEAERLSCEAVILVWDGFPSIFDGSRYKRPHKFAAAFFVVLFNIRRLHKNNVHNELFTALSTSSKHFMQYLVEQQYNLALTELDHMLIKESMEIYDTIVAPRTN